MKDDKIMESDFSNSIVLKKFKAEYASILEHKWYLSERANRDVGFNHAFIDWLRCIKLKQ